MRTTLIIDDDLLAHAARLTGVTEKTALVRLGLEDTSVWIDHLRGRTCGLADLLEQGLVLGHPFITGELACGSLARRGEILRLLEALPSAPVALHEEALRLLERRNLHGAGIGWIDVHLLAAASLAG